MHATPANHGPQRTPEPSDTEEQASFAEMALKLGGKSEDEARRTGAIDKADDQVETLFAERFQTAQSPIHRAVWDRQFPIELFGSSSASVSPAEQQVMHDSLAVARRHRDAGTLLDTHGKTSESVLLELGQAGYWGLLVDQEYGGSGTSVVAFTQFVTEMAKIDPTIAGLASIHGCIGAVNPVKTFGTPEQKTRFLPSLAQGERLSAFALTEPAAGSDLTALRTTAVLDGDHYIVNGEKLFITNVTLGRTVALVCLIDGRPAVLIVDLPQTEDEHFQLRPYGLHALRHNYNQGFVLRDFRVPAGNLLVPPKGDGLIIAYHGLNLGRVSLCANAAGTMRIMLANLLPWGKFRKTYGGPIESRELVQRRIGRMTGLIVACDALVNWCSGLLDEGYRGEMECIIAKIFGSEALKESAIELMMKTHGGRSFLHGHMFGDNIHEYLAPCIYEGEGEILGMAFFKSLVKQHGLTYFEPIGKALHTAGIKQPSPFNPAHAWALREVIAPYATWLAGQTFKSKPKPTIHASGALKTHAEFAVHTLQNMALTISGAMRKHQLKLADRQCRISDLSMRVQKAITLLCTALYAAEQDDEITQLAADCICQDLTRDLTGEAPSDRYFRTITQLGARVAEGEFKSLEGIKTDDILMPYTP